MTRKQFYRYLPVATMAVNAAGMLLVRDPWYWATNAVLFVSCAILTAGDKIAEAQSGPMVNVENGAGLRMEGCTFAKADGWRGWILKKGDAREQAS